MSSAAKGPSPRKGQVALDDTVTGLVRGMAGAGLGLCTAVAIIVAQLLSPAAAWAQGASESGESSQAEAQQEAQDVRRSPSQYDDDEGDHRSYSVGAFSGVMAGGTSLGSSQNLFFRSTFEQGSSGLFGGRIGYALATRLDLDVEFGTGSPGLDVILSDLSGQGRTEFEFADLDSTYVAGSLRYGMVRRSARLVPFLTAGLVVVSLSSSTEPGLDSSSVGALFGAGLLLRLADSLKLRVDARGLRAGGVGDGAPFTDRLNSTQIFWTGGLSYEF